VEEEDARCAGCQQGAVGVFSYGGDAQAAPDHYNKQGQHHEGT